MMCDNGKIYTIKDIYAQNVSENKPMLSAYTSDFWAGYRSNSSYFDRRFKKLYSSWFPYDQDSAEGRQAVADEFRADVYAHLMANDKRYSELYRVNVIADNDAYSLTNNVDYTEEYSEETHLDRTFDKGAQTDGSSGFTTYGQQQVDEDRSRTVGQQQVDEDMSKTFGAQDVDTTNSTSSYNDSTFTPVDKTEIENGAHTDTEDNTITYGAHTDTEDNTTTYGTHRDDTSSTRTEGARRDTTDDDGTKEYTIHKVGNMGVQTVDDMLKKHWDNWTLFDFYGLIFSEIARDLLRGVM